MQHWENPLLRPSNARETQRNRLAHYSVACETGRRPDASQLPLLTTYLSRTAAPQSFASRSRSASSCWPPSASATSASVLEPTYGLATDGRSTYGWAPDNSPPKEHKPTPRIDAKRSVAAMQSAHNRTEEEEEDEELRTSAGVSGKKSRYLCERDRCTILSRIATGEKQSLLAKEYKVTRAAICYLKKHREDVLARSHANPMAKHPKKPRRTVKKARADTPNSDLATSSGRCESASIPKKMVFKAQPTAIERYETKAPNQHPQGPQVFSEDGQAPHHLPQGAFLHEIRTRSVALLLTSIENTTTSTAEFRRSTDRIMHLLAEEALASVAVVRSDVFINGSEHVVGLHAQHPSCAISMMPSVCPLLTTFQLLEPDLPGAYVHVNRLKSDASSSSYWPTNAFSVLVSQTALPPDVEQYNMFVLDLVAKSGEILCGVVNQLLERGAYESMITIVALFVASEAIAIVHEQYPEVRFLVIQVDEFMAANRPSRGELFWKRCTRSYGMRVRRT